LTVISELSGAVVVVATSFALVFAFVFDVDSLLQLAIRTASEAIPTAVRIFLITLLPPSTLNRIPRGKLDAISIHYGSSQSRMRIALD
jgi:hypothetical protein